MAASLGWYMFPPKEIELVFDGTDVLYAENGHWVPFTYVPFDTEIRAAWDAQLPERLKGRMPAMLTNIPAPGVVQIWSGFFAATVPGWSSQVRPIPNANFYGALDCYEGVVDTDTYGPWPIFINLRITATNRPILLHPDRPLFQIQPIPRALFTEGRRPAPLRDAFGVDGLSAAQWDGYGATMRSVDRTEEPDRTVGTYAAQTRKRQRAHA